MFLLHSSYFFKIIIILILYQIEYKMKYFRARIEKRLNSKIRIFENSTNRENIKISFHSIKIQCDYEF